MGCEAGLALSGFNRATAQAPRLVEPPEQQTGAPQRVIVPAEGRRPIPSLLDARGLFAFLEPRQRLARLADLREDPGGGGDHGAKDGSNAPLPGRRDPALDH